MLRSPYPVPRSRWVTALLVAGWAVGGLAAPWILVFPPVTYEGVGLVASYGWGVMYGVGSLLIAYAYAREDYRVEIPGIGLALGGLAVYQILTWGQVFSGVTGTGSRGLLLTPFLAWLLARLLRLVSHHAEIKGLQRVARRSDGSA